MAANPAARNKFHAYRLRHRDRILAADAARKRAARQQEKRDRVVQRVVPALGQKPVPVRAVLSVFDLARSIAMAVAEMPPAPVEVTPSTPRPWRPVVVAQEGVTRVSGAQYPSNRWTAEREEQERVRRAKQTPPKPSKAARTKSRKLRDLIGGDDG